MSREHERTFVWHFERPVEAIWPALADTQRFNEAAGLPKHEITESLRQDGSVRYHASARFKGFELRWREVPVEWIEHRWFRHLRVFESGPLRTIDAHLSLEAEGGGCIGRYRLRARAANPIGAALLATGFFPSAEKKFTRLAEEAKLWAAGGRERLFGAPPPPPPFERRALIDGGVRRVEESGHGLAERISAWCLSAQDVDLMRIRPRELARRWDVAERPLIEASLQSVREGLLEMRWDLLCPRCRGAKITVSSLDQLPRAAHCGACNVGYDRDFARNVELTFRPAPVLREVSDGEYCLFGPMSTPHVRAQIIVPPGGERSFEGSLAPGAYRLRTLEVGGATDMEYEGGGFPAVVARAGGVAPGEAAPSGNLVFRNGEDRPRTLIVESRAWVGDALTAHRVTTLQGFRDLFPAERLAPGEEADVSQVVLMFTDLKGSTALYERVGDATAYRMVRRHFALLAATVRDHDGAMVKTIGDAVMAAFTRPRDAVAAALDAIAAVDVAEDDLEIKIGIHAGPCVAVTLNDRLDYFGGAVNMAARLQGESTGGDIVLSEAVASAGEVAPLLEGHDIARESARLGASTSPWHFCASARIGDQWSQNRERRP